jgi:ABC-type dipeptide/oligopeptide/nickel transport system permease subunit
LPACILGAGIAGGLMRLTRAQMLQVMSEDFVRTAHAKGLDPRSVVLVHGFRNALIPVVTVIGLRIPLVVGGAVILETIFNIPGIGRFFVNAMGQRDFPVVQAVIALVAITVVFTNPARGPGLPSWIRVSPAMSDEHTTAERCPNLDTDAASAERRLARSRAGCAHTRRRRSRGWCSHRPAGRRVRRIVAPYPFDAGDLDNRMAGPSAEHLLGTDKVGRDVFSRIIFGTRQSVLVAVGAVLLSQTLAVAVGLASATRRLVRHGRPAPDRHLDRAASLLFRSS